MLEFPRPTIPFDEIVCSAIANIFIIGIVGGFKFDREFGTGSHNWDGGLQPAWLYPGGILGRVGEGVFRCEVPGGDSLR